MAEFRLETERLVLREWRESDIDPFMHGLNTPDVTKWLGGPKARADFEAMFERMSEEQAETGHCFWIVERRSDNSVLGFCGARIGGHPGSPVHGKIELGWRLRQDVWGQGIAKEAALATIDWCWRNLGCAELVAYTVPQNVASWGLMERLGMSRRPDLSFEHPQFARGHPLCQHITYSIARPKDCC